MKKVPKLGLQWEFALYLLLLLIIDQPFKTNQNEDKVKNEIGYFLFLNLLFFILRWFLFFHYFLGTLLFLKLYNMW